MLFSSETIIVFSLGIISIILNIYLFIKVTKIASHYNSLTKGVEQKGLMNVLEGIQRTLSQHEKLIAQNHREIDKIHEVSKSYIKEIGLKRFNPFGDTGGDQSFILSLVDGNKDGVVITSLHSRENTRFYVKSVNGGVGIDHPLSQEEQKTINRKGK